VSPSLGEKSTCWIPGILEYEHPKDLDHPHEVSVQHEAEEFQSTTGCLFHTDGLCIAECFNSYIQCFIYYTQFSIHPFHLQSKSHSTTPQATNIFNPLFDLPLTMQPSNSRSPLLTELLEDNARLR